MFNIPENIQNIITKIIIDKSDNSDSSSKFNVKNVAGSLKSIIISSIRENNPHTTLLLCSDNNQANDFYHDFLALEDENNIILITQPKIKSSLHFFGEEISFWLIDALASILNSTNPIIITTPEILELGVPKPESLISTKMTLSKGLEINLEDLTTQLLLDGFERKDFVSSPGELALRGGILDIFPIDRSNPLRIEFFGDEIESIRSFDSLSQRSIDYYDSVGLISKIYHDEDKNTFTSDLFSYLDSNTLIFSDIPENIEISSDVEFKINQHNIVFFNRIGDADIVINSKPQPDFDKSLQKLKIFLNELISYKYNIFICADGKSNLSRIKDLLESAYRVNEDEDVLLENNDASGLDIINKINWYPKSFASGFISDDLSTAIINEHQVFGRTRIQNRKRKNKSTLSINSLRELNIGDLVVHDDKGIGAFDGLEIVELGGKHQECVRLKYTGNDILYVHLNYIDKLHKYNSQEGIEPKLSNLNSTEWARKKNRAKKKLKDIARDLIKLYAERKTKVGYSYPEDSLWQKEFEASFIYEDTIDQARTNDEVKQDMESNVPMDRLVCGDVGFGKTEIAIRAAFKAVQSGKQVAVLVPTTILAQQHYLTFKDRLNNYPVIIDVISRFKSSSKQKDIIKDTTNGKIDILIGTHRLLSKDIKFQELGLLIIDEEHRFGVTNKERLKELKSNVDTLTLTATPIPRTLNFSLMGARDLSVIETAPRNRLPIDTVILEWKDEEIKKAIEFEINRGGQVFFVSDKVSDLDLILFDLQKLMPGIRFCLVHGQMSSNEIEKNMQKFIEGKYDVLVATKIIESGLDIPNANTIIINRADKFGLAELYQLRGRVGRSNIQAYCYIVIPDAKKLTLNSIKRLQAIEEFSNLGSGFQLALRDLEIRGAGNLLGAEQSGFINDIGFDLFQKILNEAVKELKSEEFSDELTVDYSYLNNHNIQIDVNTDALLPERYISSDKERFIYYKRLYNLNNKEELDEIAKEIKDKYGKFPSETIDLFYAVKLRIAALNTGFSKIELTKSKLIIEFPSSVNKKFYSEIFPDLIDVITEFDNSLLKQKGKTLVYEVPIQSKDDALEKIWRMKKTIDSIK